MTILKTTIIICTISICILTTYVVKLPTYQEVEAICEDGSKSGSFHRSTNLVHGLPEPGTNKKMQINLLDMQSSTDPKHTYVLFDSDQKFFVGQELHATIVAKNYRNEPKRIGGDFFQALIHRTAVAGDGVAAKVVDYDNGTYFIRAPLLWKGNARLRVALVHPTEAVFALKLKTSEANGDGFGFMSKVFDLATMRNKTLECGPFLHDKERACNFSNPVYGEPWYCERPRGGCDLITSYGRADSSPGTKRWRTEWIQYFNKSQNWMKEVEGSGRYFEIGRSPTEKGSRRRILPPCSLGTQQTDGKSVTGYFLNNQWRSTSCNNRPFSGLSAKKCLRNYILYFIGDSTARQLFSFTTISLKLTKQDDMKSNVSFRPRSSYSEIDHINLYYRAHGPPLQHYGLFNNREYISVVMGKIAQAVNPERPIAIILSFGLHFLSFRPSYFEQRVGIIKASILRLRRQIPALKVLVKGINFHYDFAYALPRAQWLCYRMNGILKAEFAGVENVAFVNTWDMTLVQTPTEVHPKPHMIRHQMGLILSYICPT